LPENVREFYCLANLRKDAKCQAIYNLLTNEEEVDTNNNGNIENFPQKLQDLKNN